MTQFYRHYKGGLYQKLHEATHSETGEAVVVYRCVETVDGSKPGDDQVWVRPREMFHGEVDSRPRFDPVSALTGA